MMFRLPAKGIFFKKPIMGRCFRLLICSISLLASAWAGAEVIPNDGVLTEEEAVHRALALSALEEVTGGLLGIAEAEEVRMGLWPDPELAFNREEIRGDRGAVQDFVMLAQTFDFSGRRGLQHKAAGLRVQAVRNQGEAIRNGIEAEVRLQFHELLTARLRVQTIEVWMDRIENALNIVIRREAAGDAASYERRQLERELANTQARLSMHRAESGQAWARLAALMGEIQPNSRPPELSGVVLPEAPESIERLASRVTGRPDIVAFRALEEAAQTESKAAARWWAPRSTFGLGWTGLDMGGQRDDGYVAMATISLPLFQRGRASSLKADSEARLARGQQELAQSQALGEVRIRAAELIRLIDAAKQHRRDVLDRSAALIRTAEAGYAGDELRILELLDTYRGAIDDEMTTLDLEIIARRAHIYLQEVSGDYRP